MFKIIKKGSLVGNKVNEDKSFTSEDLIIFLDGASGLSKNLIPKSKSDAFWYVNRFTELFQASFSEYKKKRYAIRKTIDQIDKEYNKLVKDKYSNNLNTPSAAGVILFFDQDYLKGFFFGDVITTIIKTDGKTKSYYDKALTNLDNQVLNEAKRISEEENIPYNIAIKECRDLIMKNRELKNKPDGYYIFSLDKNSTKNINTFKIHKNNVDKLLIMSDGFYSAFPNSSTSDLVSLIKSSKGNSLLVEVKNQFLKDPSYNKFNRFKLVDDISYALIKVKSHD